MIRIISLKSVRDINKVVSNIFKIEHSGIHHNKILDLLTSANVHLMLVDIDSTTEKSLKKQGYKLELQPKVSI